ncbi:hypothetical protein LXL04_034079 [Taraxacum kok-saghyz]
MANSISSLIVPIDDSPSTVRDLKPVGPILNLPTVRVLRAAQSRLQQRLFVFIRLQIVDMLGAQVISQAPQPKHDEVEEDADDDEKPNSPKDNTEKTVKATRPQGWCRMLILASSFVGTADMDLIDLIYNFIKECLQEEDDNIQREAYALFTKSWCYLQRSNTVIYEDVSLERGAFLVQQVMRAFRANNVESAKSRLSLCAQDIREQQEITGNTSKLCSQLGAVLGMLGDCCRAMGDAISAVAYFDDSVTFLSKVETDDLEVAHTLSVSLNKIGDMKDYEGDLKSARDHYFRALDVRRNAINDSSKAPSQVLDVAVSLAKVADVDRNLDAEDSPTEGFQEAIKLLECLKINSEENALEKRVCIVFT